LLPLWYNRRAEVDKIAIHVTLQGSVFSGLGQGAYFTGLDWVREQCREKLGFTPFPGTLNLRASTADLVLLRHTAAREGVEITPPTAEFCPATALPLTIEGQTAAAILPRASGFTDETHGTEVLEVIAPLGLKGKLGLQDGDRINLSYQVEEP
jgi:CTP-dependent riboflavin kinase